MKIIFIIFAVAFGVAFLMILGSSAYIGATVFRIFRKAAGDGEFASPTGSEDAHDPARLKSEDDSSHHHRVLEMLKQLPPGTEPYKCLNCGATVDSTAEISPTGEIKCNYCHSRTNLFK